MTTWPTPALARGPRQGDQMVEVAQFSRGVCWLLIAVTLLVCLCEAPIWGRFSRSLLLVWVGVFVLYYALRSAPGRSRWCLGWGRRGFVGRALCGLPLASVADLVVISLCVALSGGWASPLYLLYFGWAMTVLAERSAPRRLVLSGLAPCCLVGGVVLAAHQQLSREQETITVEHIVLVLLVALSMHALSMYLAWSAQCWAAERERWQQLRQIVFSQLAHELFTPLSVIETSAALLADQEAFLTEARRRQMLKSIGRNCARMSLLLDELLELWRSMQHQPSKEACRVECVSLARELVETLEPLFAAKKQECEVLAEPPVAAALAHRQRLEQVLVNLLSNAQKYSPMHARVRLEISGQHDVVLFAVRDEGPGIPREEQRRVFDLAFRGSSAAACARGAGLGLALAKALVVAQGGSIWVESCPGQGSTFYFTVPRALEEASDAYFAG